MQQQEDASFRGVRQGSRLGGPSLQQQHHGKQVRQGDQLHRPVKKRTLSAPGSLDVLDVHESHAEERAQTAGTEAFPRSHRARKPS
eukprot:scaffold110396_cov12-Tisochrysis_lutea.AAC.1